LFFIKQKTRQFLAFGVFSLILAIYQKITDMPSGRHSPCPLFYLPGFSGFSFATEGDEFIPAITSAGQALMNRCGFRRRLRALVRVFIVQARLSSGRWKRRFRGRVGGMSFGSAI
jgi:hypothetical protein